MEDETTFGSVQERTSAGWGPLARILKTRFTHAFENTSAPFEICLPDQSVHRFGRTAPCFRFVLKNRSAVWALASLDAGRFADAYLAAGIRSAQNQSQGDHLTLRYRPGILPILSRPESTLLHTRHVRIGS